MCATQEDRSMAGPKSDPTPERAADPSITIRRGTPDDTRKAFDVSMAAVEDLFTRQGVAWTLDPDEFYTSLEPVLTHFATKAAEWWVAEDDADSSLIGYARSIERGSLLELSEFFVRPGRQSAGLGRQLIERAFPPCRGEVRAIVALTDVRALAHYYRAGTVARFPIADLTGTPSPSAAESGAAASKGGLEVVSAGPDLVAEFAAVEEAVVGFPRHGEYPLLFEQRAALLFRRDGRAVGFAFVGVDGTGPIAALVPEDQVPILLEVEAWAVAHDVSSLSFELPMVNEVAMRHLLGRGFKIEPPLSIFMSNKPFGQFDRYILFSPPFVF
jgi:GNAT superfamily N-acetyltransferase